MQPGSYVAVVPLTYLRFMLGVHLAGALLFLGGGGGWGGARLTPIVPDANIGYGPVLPASPRRSQCCSQKFEECSQINCHGMTQTD